MSGEEQGDLGISSENITCTLLWVLRLFLHTDCFKMKEPDYDKDVSK